MSKEKALVNAVYLLHKFPGKGGWTYAEIPEIIQNGNYPFGWVKVKGSIDDFELKQYKLMPMGKGRLFLPVRVEIRKKIKKEAGDTVKVILYSDESPLLIPEEMIACFENETKAIYKTFLSFTEGEQKSYMDWVYKAKSEDTKAGRIIQMMDKLRKKQRLNDK